MRVIIECESCHTRFRLDDARIPATGAKVRCSRCKTAFMVKRPGATRDQLVDEVVAEVTGSGGSSAPSATEDLFDTSAGGANGIGGASDAVAGESSSDEKWEFDEAPSASATAAASKRPSAPAAPKPAAPAPAAESSDEDESFDTLGSPEGWDLVGGSAQKLAAEARFDETVEPAPEPAPARLPRPTAPAIAPRTDRSVERALAAAAFEASAAEHAPPVQPGWIGAARRVGQFGIDSGVWIASILLCAAGLALAFAPRANGGAVPANTLAATLGDQRLEVTLHRVESGVGGTLTVVRGQLPEALASREPMRLRARWVDAQGAVLAGASAIVGPPAAHDALRSQSATRLQSAAESGARSLSASGPFEAVFAELPAGAKGISLTRERVPTPPPAATQEEATATEPTTASSRPTVRPSSE